MTLDHDEKVAILLDALGDEAVDPASSQVTGPRATQIREQLASLKENPPSTELVETVLEDFERFFRFAIEAAGAENYWSNLIDDQGLKVVSDDDPDDEQPEAEVVKPKKKKKRTHPPEIAELDDEEEEVEYLDASDLDDSKGPIKKFRIFRPTDDEVKDLGRLHPAQIAKALEEERPKTIAIVLQSLTKVRNAAVIALLPQELHGDLLQLMLTDLSIQPDLKRKIIRTVVDRALTVEQREEEKPDPMSAIAEVLRELPRDLRNNMVTHLREADEDKADALQKLLYRFEDFVKFEDRSIQKILAEVDKGQLIIALQPAEDELKERVLSNLSRRAKDALLEEMELLGKQPADAITDAQDVVCEVMATLDQAGQLEVM